MAKGRDLADAAVDVDLLKESRTTLKEAVQLYSDRLETCRERIEGAARLHHLLALDLKEKDVQLEMQRLAEKIGDAGLIERCRQSSLKHGNTQLPVTSTPTKASDACACWRSSETSRDEGNDAKTTAGRGDRKRTLHAESKGSDHSVHDDDEDHSKMADSGLGGCDRCEGNDKLVRTCSCQSLDEPANACSKR